MNFDANIKINQSENIQENYTSDAVDSSLKELANEAGLLFNVLDTVSNKIRRLETTLKDSKAHFPFSVVVETAAKSSIKSCEKRHLNKSADTSLLLGYRTQVSSSLSWELDDNSKSYRLFISSEEVETIGFLVTVFQSESNASWEHFKSECILKKPLIETDLSTRLRFAKYLNVFIIDFKNHLKINRLSIELSAFYGTTESSEAK